MKPKDFENDLEFGRQVFESVPKKARPGWGILLLQVFDNFLDSVPTPIIELRKIAAHEEKWGQAHKQFTKIRNLSLLNPTKEPETYILLAEKVAKITYNESGLPAPFDHDSGWWITILAKRTADYFESEQLKQEVKQILTMNMVNE